MSCTSCNRDTSKVETLADKKPNISIVWKDFVTSKKNGTRPPLPDFSYAGYQNSEQQIPSPDWKVFDVTEYGATPDDGNSDLQAIQDAIAATKEDEGAIIYFPKGRYLLSEKEKVTKSLITVHRDNIIFRGEGSEENGTELYFKYHLNTNTPQKMWTTPEMVTFIGNPSFYKGVTVTTATKNAQLGDFKISVEDTSELSVGDFIVINLNDKSAGVDSFLGPYKVQEEWTGFKAGEFLREYHQIVAINQGQLTLKAPLHMDIDASFVWQIRKVELGQMLGIEDIAFVGNWKDEFVHHKNSIHDSGWSAIKIDKYANSWVKNVRFKDWNEALTINAGYAITAEKLTIEGNKGHFGIHITSSFGVLVSDSHDITKRGQHHTLSVSSYAAGTVFHNTSWPEDTSFDTHARYPHATLFDNSSGGFSGSTGGSGGGKSRKPNHLSNLVLWNFRDIGKKKVSSHSWWGNDTVLLPKIIGWHGTLPKMKHIETSIIESFGSPVEPASLFEAQLNLRLNGE